MNRRLKKTMQSARLMHCDPGLMPRHQGLFEEVYKKKGMPNADELLFLQMKTGRPWQFIQRWCMLSAFFHTV